MQENKYLIKEFESVFESQVQELENYFVRSSHFFGLIKLERSYGDINYNKYFSQKYGNGFILLIHDQQSSNKVVGKAIFSIKDIQIKDQSQKAVFINELRILPECNSNLQLEKQLIEFGLAKAEKEFQSKIAYTLIDQQNGEKFDPILIDNCKFQKVGDILSQIALQNNLIMIDEKIGEDLKFREVQPSEAIQLHNKSKLRGDLYCKQNFEQPQAKTYAFLDEKADNVYGMSVFTDDKRYTKNFTRFVISSKLLQNRTFINLFYAFVNIFFLSLLWLERNDQGLLHDDLKFKMVLYLGLNVGICLGFLQIQKAFRRFTGSVGRIYQPIEIETNPQTCNKRFYLNYQQNSYLFL